MKKHLCVLLSFLVFSPLSGCSLFQRATPLVQVENPVWNVGRLPVSTEQIRTFTVRNAGTAPLVIEKVEQCCGFYGAMNRTTLPPGEKAELQTRLRMSQMVGDLHAEIFLVSNDPANPRYPVTAVGKVVPRIQANAELITTSVDLGIVQPGDAVPFEVRIKSSGNERLQLKGIEKTRSIHEVSSQLEIGPGEEGVLRFRFVAGQGGPIEESVTISTNDPLQETLPFRVKGYVARDWVPDRAVIIYPVGKTIHFNPVLQSYQYDLVLENRGEKDIELRSLESSLPLQLGPIQGLIGARSKGGGTVSFSIPATSPKPVNGTVLLQLALPVEIR